MDIICPLCWRRSLVRSSPKLAGQHFLFSSVREDLCSPGWGNPSPLSLLYKQCLLLARCLFPAIPTDRGWSFTVLWVINSVSHTAGSSGVFFRISKARVQVPDFELLHYTVSVYFSNMAARNLLRWLICRVAIGLLFFPRPSLFSVWSPDWQYCIHWCLWELQNLRPRSRTTESESAF